MQSFKALEIGLHRLELVEESLLGSILNEIHCRDLRVADVIKFT